MYGEVGVSLCVCGVRGYAWVQVGGNAMYVRMYVWSVVLFLEIMFNVHCWYVRTYVCTYVQCTYVHSVLMCL